jgi:hypothetical protein
MEDPSCDFVWLDITNKDEVLPFYQDSIMAKVLRAADAPTLKRKTVLRRKNMENFASSISNGGAAIFSKQSANDAPPVPPKKQDSSRLSSTASAAKQQDRTAYTDDAPPSASAPTPAPRQAPTPAPRQAPAPSPIAKPAPSPAAAQADILDFEPSTSTSAPAASSAKSASSAASPKPTPVSAPVSDMLDFDDGPAAVAAPAPSTPANISSANLEAMMDLDSAPTLSRAELKAGREDKINDQVQKAVDEKREVSNTTLHFLRTVLASCCILCGTHKNAE